MSDLCIYDYAVNKVVAGLGLSTSEGERVALSWEGNAGFDALKLLKNAREKMSDQSKDQSKP